MQSKLPFSRANGREIASLCERYSVQHLGLFGSSAHGDFGSAGSDVDVTVQFQRPPDLATATHYFDLKHDLEALFGRPVDLVELSAMPDSRLKREIERTQVVIYDRLD